MKKTSLLASLLVLGLGLAPALAQMGPPGAGAPNLGGSLSKLFGANQAFSAKVEIHATTENGEMVMPAKVSFDNQKARFEFNMLDMKGTQMPAEVAARVKEMGMDQMISISRPDLKVNYMIYPSLHSYLEVPTGDAAAKVSPDDYTVDTSKLGEETVEGHACTKNKVTITAKDGTKSEATVWDASDLKDFPIKVETDNGGRPATMYFRDISFSKPAGSQFDLPSGLNKYNDMRTMMQNEMMKKMGGAMPPPPTGQN
jgi:hypothetical protein